MLAEDVADKDAAVGRCTAGRTTSLVDLDKGPPFELNGFLDLNTAFSYERVAQLRNNACKLAINARRDAVFTGSACRPGSGKQSLQLGQGTY